MLRPAPTPIPPKVKSNSVPDSYSTLFVGVNYGYSVASSYNTASVEYIFGDADSWYLTGSQSGSTLAGGGGSGAIYIGGLYGITDANSYQGPSHTFGGTASIGPVGITAGIILGAVDSNAPSGWFIGIAPGLQASLWYSNNYTERLDPGANDD